VKQQVEQQRHTATRVYTVTTISVFKTRLFLWNQ